jgi:hypothetical protein
MGGRMWAQRRRRGGSEFGFSLAAYPIEEDEAFVDADATDGAGEVDGTASAAVEREPSRSSGQSAR